MSHKDQPRDHGKFQKKRGAPFITEQRHLASYLKMIRGETIELAPPPLNDVSSNEPRKK